jgi:hypothetical protein
MALELRHPETLRDDTIVLSLSAFPNKQSLVSAAHLTDNVIVAHDVDRPLAEAGCRMALGVDDVTIEVGQLQVGAARLDSLLLNLGAAAEAWVQCEGCLRMDGAEAQFYPADWFQGMLERVLKTLPARPLFAPCPRQ